MKKGSYIFDFILFGLISSLIFGLIGNGAQPVRLLILALSPVMLTDVFRGSHKSIYYYRYECFFLLFWILWAMSFYYKAVDGTESMKHIIYLVIHVLGFFEIIWAANKAVVPQQSIRYGWLAVIAMSIPVAIYEFLTDFHLPMSYQDSGANVFLNGVHIERPFASVTFGNLNSYNTVLCWAMPSLFMCNLYPRNRVEQLAGYFLMLLTSLIIVANASRASILCLGVMLSAYVLAYYRYGRNRYLLITILFISIAAIVYYLGDVFILAMERFSDLGRGDDWRAENLAVGFQAFLDSYGLGIGVGNYEPIMGDVYRVLIPAPHNLLLEVLVCFGLLVALGFVGMLLHLVQIAFKKGTPFNRTMFMFCGFALLFAGIIDSNYLMKATTWMFVATIYIYVDSRYNHQLPQRT